MYFRGGRGTVGGTFWMWNGRGMGVEKGWNGSGGRTAGGGGGVMG